MPAARCPAEQGGTEPSPVHPARTARLDVPQQPRPDHPLRRAAAGPGDDPAAGRPPRYRTASWQRARKWGIRPSLIITGLTALAGCAHAINPAAQTGTTILTALSLGGPGLGWAGLRYAQFSAAKAADPRHLYQAALRHLVMARNTRCTAPGCGRPATDGLPKQDPRTHPDVRVPTRTPHAFLLTRRVTPSLVPCALWHVSNDS